jgi:hypothetical protein
MYSLRSVFEPLFLRCIQRKLRPLGNSSCSVYPSSSGIHRYHRIDHSVALGMGRRDSLLHFGVILFDHDSG